MVEQENTRLAERLASIASALVKPAATNGHSVVATSLSDELIDAWAKGTVPFIRECIADAVKPLKEHSAELEARNAVCEQRIVELEAHVIKLEQAPTMVYRGVWDAQTGYFVGDFVTDHGSLWHCNRSATGVRPPESCWTLAVKSTAKGR